MQVQTFPHTGSLVILNVVLYLLYESQNRCEAPPTFPLPDETGKKWKVRRFRSAPNYQQETSKLHVNQHRWSLLNEYNAKVENKGQSKVVWRSETPEELRTLELIKNTSIKYNELPKKVKGGPPTFFKGNIVPPTWPTLRRISHEITH